MKLSPTTVVAVYRAQLATYFPVDKSSKYVIAVELLALNFGSFPSGRKTNASNVLATSNTRCYEIFPKLAGVD